MIWYMNIGVNVVCIDVFPKYYGQMSSFDFKANQSDSKAFYDSEQLYAFQID